ncbi:unnamed protein product [Polarella glacialis]|uniref:Uncharacterized protein n=1 Tax=Polarella glacialis TaxID=89957 RepID=A0A813E402_POLGL|nr:unnamed protein product [Polarella glacialis]
MQEEIESAVTQHKLDNAVKNRWINAMRKRSSSFREDMKTLNDVMRAARHPKGALSLKLREMENNSFTGFELHRRVPAHMWCVTEADIDEFVKKVALAHGAGRIPNDTHPVTGKNNEAHDHPDFGPSIHMVVKYVVVPESQAAGGMSWALARHPDGLPVNIFMTHCWEEGIYEFHRKVKRYIHGGISARTNPETETDPRPATPHIWCCFLANPQCWPRQALKELLGQDPMKSPFAKALMAKNGAGELLAKCVWLVSNHATSIYNRLWCVLELKIAMDLGLPIVFSLSSASVRRRKGDTPMPELTRNPQQKMRLNGVDLGSYKVIDQLLLGFDGVQHAECSDPDDAKLIRDVVKGSEGQLDTLIERISFANTYAMLVRFHQYEIEEKLGEAAIKDLLKGILVVDCTCLP